MLKFNKLRDVNIKRSKEVFPSCKGWTPTDWACAMAGEAGEVCNMVKKLRRLQDGWSDPKDPQTAEETVSRIGSEIADTIIYLDLLAARLGLNLGEEVKRKFNSISLRTNSQFFL